MADRGNLVSAAKISFEKITSRSCQAICQTMPGGNTLSYLKHLRPVDGTDAHVWRLFRQRDTPDTRTGPNVQHTERPG